MFSASSSLQIFHYMKILMFLTLSSYSLLPHIALDYRITTSQIPSSYLTSFTELSGYGQICIVKNILPFVFSISSYEQWDTVGDSAQKLNWCSMMLWYLVLCSRLFSLLQMSLPCVLFSTQVSYSFSTVITEVMLMTPFTFLRGNRRKRK